jgi:hypothetical protein
MAYPRNEKERCVHSEQSHNGRVDAARDFSQVRRTNYLTKHAPAARVRRFVGPALLK